MIRYKRVQLFISHPYSLADPVGYTLKIWSFLPTSASAALIQVIFTSHLDNHSSPLTGPFAFVLTNLQSVLLTVPRIIIFKI